MIGEYEHQHTLVNCGNCGWAGRGGKTLDDEEFGSREGCVYCCPRCYEVIGAYLYPTLEEKRANWDRLPAEERRHVDWVEARLAKFEAGELKTPLQLSELGPGPFVVEWDFEVDGDGERWTLLRRRGRLIWREIAFYEGYWRFAEIATLLRQRYGAAVVDLEPTPASELYLFGDYMGSLDVVKRAREEIGSKGGSK